LGFVRKINLHNFQVATSETVRDINSRIMLNLVRKHQPVSRADLMRYSGLQRSTVSAITGQLIAGRWLKEGAVGHLPRGRKPTFLHLNTERCGVVGVDIQPTTTTLAVAGMDSQFLAQEFMPTAKDPVEFISRLTRRITDLMQAHPRHSYEGVGISLPGRIDASGQQLIFAPTLGWSGLDLKTQLERNLGLSVELENAANACALVESWSGRHMDGVRNLVVVTVSDDIGVGMILDGQLVRGANGMAGEFGHVPQMPGGPRCRCGNTGCWEVLASNAAAVRYYSESFAHMGKVVSKSKMSGLVFGDILRLADRNDVLAREALNQMVYHLGEGIAMLVTGLAPDILLVVGEVTRAWAKVGPIVAEAVKRRSCFTHATTRILPTDPEAKPRLRGAMALVLQKHFDVPVIG
jgi:predicted NBD/HSP70 family sugar kinase